MPKRALITGITGQDGCYLSRLLLSKGYEVTGILDPRRDSSLLGLKVLAVLDKVRLERCDLQSYTDTERLIVQLDPHEVYHLAAQSSVAESYRLPSVTMHINTIPVSNLLEAIRLLNPAIRFYHASSSEMFGRVNVLPVIESTPFCPISPYAVSKVAAHQLVTCYRESYSLFAVSGILFNHESALRRANFFTSKLIRESRELQAGDRKFISFGNLDVRRDIGYAPRYVEAMWQMLQIEQPFDFLICSGSSVSLRDLVYHVFRRLGLPYDAIVVEPSLFRPNDITDIYGSNHLARDRLGWTYDMSAFDVMDQLLVDTLGQ